MSIFKILFLVVFAVALSLALKYGGDIQAYAGILICASAGVAYFLTRGE